MREKSCTKCGEAKKPAKFPRNKRTRDGLSSWCRSCHNEARRVVPRYVHLDGGDGAEPGPKAEVEGAVRGSRVPL